MHDRAFPQERSAMQTQRYTNGVLTAIGALLALHLVGTHHFKGDVSGSGIATANAAQPEAYRRAGTIADRPVNHMDPTEGGMISAAEQRKMIINELRALNARLGAIEASLGDGVNVTVTEMPEMNWPAQPPAPDAASTPPAGTP
jgi:hypothetical protein